MKSRSYATSYSPLFIICSSNQSDAFGITRLFLLYYHVTALEMKIIGTNGWSHSIVLPELFHICYLMTMPTVRISVLVNLKTLV